MPRQIFLLAWVWRVRLRLESAAVSHILLLAKKVADKMFPERLVSFHVFTANRNRNVVSFELQPLLRWPHRSCSSTRCPGSATVRARAIFPYARRAPK
ncbi:hypothetical protein F4803DRAFT_544138 [Xylaria telfairii]|nr:hypothetical protein F4803DRAFT_544138 [Xylaria telfairii]